MATKILRLRSQLLQSYSTNSSLMRNKFDAIQTKMNSYELPERYKGTAIEKWLKYWKSLFIDYRDVFIDVGKHIKEKPIRSTIYGGIGASVVYCSKHNPTETDFINNLRLHNGNMILVNEICQNPTSSQYLIFLERCYNEKIVRRLNIGVASLLWLDNFDRAASLYKAICPHTKVELSTWHQRVIDVGFLDKWWKLEEKMLDYDVNEANL